MKRFFLIKNRMGLSNEYLMQRSQKRKAPFITFPKDLWFVKTGLPLRFGLCLMLLVL